MREREVGGEMEGRERETEKHKIIWNLILETKSKHFVKFYEMKILFKFFLFSWKLFPGFYQACAFWLSYIDYYVFVI